MSRSRGITLVAGALLLVSAIASVLLLRRVDRSREAATLQDVLYISSPKTLKHLSLGYEGLLADIYWTRAVQYFGSGHAAGAEHFELLAPLLEITTGLDPKLTVAYEFGANFLPRNHQMVQASRKGQSSSRNTGSRTTPVIGICTTT